MILKEAFTRPTLESYDGKDCITITGREITGATKEAKNALIKEQSFPLRYRLEYLQRAVIDTLHRMGRPLQTLQKESGPTRPIADVLSGANSLLSDLRETMDEIIEDGFEPLDEHSNLRTWVIDSDPQDVFECIYSTSALLKDGSGWKYGDVCGLLALWCIDESIARIEENEPYKAAAWAGYAERYYQWQNEFSHSHSGDGSQDSPWNLFSERGLAERHAHNRAMKFKALALYASKTWSSQAEAARRLAAEVNMTEKVVEKWIREYRRGISTGKGSAVPEGE